MNIFQNMNLRPVSHFQSSHEITTEQSEAIKKAEDKYRSVIIEQQFEEENEREFYADVNDHRRELEEKVSKQAYVSESNISKLNIIQEKAKVEIFEQILFDIFYEALVLDDDFKKDHMDDLFEVIENYVEMNGGFKLLEDATIRTNSPFFKKLQESAKVIARNLSIRIMKEANENAAEIEIEFKITPDEEKEVAKLSDNLSTKQIANEIKKKVIEVIEDERESEKHTKELMQDIEDDLVEDSDVQDHTAAQEAVNRILANKPIVNESLFKALMKDTMKELLTENVVVSAGGNSTPSDYVPVNTVLKTGNPVEPEINPTEMNKLKVDDDGTIDKHVDMDLVLAETITRYTLMETLHTLNLVKFTREGVKEAISNIINYKK